MSTLLTSAGLAFQASTEGPYKVLKTAKVGGEGGTDYIYADPVGRRLYITRGATQAQPATDTRPEVPAFEKRLSIFDLDTLEPVGTIPGIGGNGAAVCPNTGHGFTSDHPQPAMFDVKTMKMIKSIEVPPPATPGGPAFSADGIYCDTSSDRVYIGSHPTKSLLVVDAKDGSVLGQVDLGGTPEQTVGDGKGTIYQVLQERPGGVAVIDVKTMKVTKTYPLGDNGSCNGLNLDVKNQILFAACAAVGPAPARGGGPGAAVPPAPAPAAAGAPPAQGPQAMVILSARDGKILARLPLAGSSDGVAFNPATLEAFSTQGNGTMTIVKEKSPTSFVVEQNLKTWPSGGARTVAFDSKTGHLFAMASEALPPPPPPPPPPPGTQGTPPPAGGRGGGRGSVPGSFTIIMVGIK
jgi:DNA-binding beta-propeller fold protein YncE